jgi:AcrR family transcriptional regulator
VAGRARSGTRDRVLVVALALFNERGADRVTIADIAHAAGINEGNLYYYFQKKEHLVLALFEGFAAAAVAAAEREVSDPRDPVAYAMYQRGWFDVMWEYRFFYRDGGALRVLAPGLRDGLAALRTRSQAAVRHVYLLMRTHGLMRASDEDIEILITNVWIVSSYWMDFCRGDTGGAVTREDLAWGLRQVERLVRPYLLSRSG